MDCHYSWEEGGKGRLLKADHVKESRFFAFSLPASTTTPNRAGSAAAAEHPALPCTGALLGDTALPPCTLEGMRGALLCLQEPPLAPGAAEGTGSCSQPPPPRNLTAVSGADNVRGQEATHLKPYLEHAVEA